jgi:hypothetical protein
MKRAVRAREVEVGARESQSFSVSLDELRVRQRTRTRELEQLGHRVDSDDLAHERREGERQRAGSGADVEGPFVTARPNEVTHLSGESRSTVVLVHGKALRRAGEAVS